MFLSFYHYRHIMSSHNNSRLSFYTFLDYEVAKNIVLIINALICLSYPVNFAIYCGMSRLIIISIIFNTYNVFIMMSIVIVKSKSTHSQSVSDKVTYRSVEKWKCYP